MEFLLACTDTTTTQQKVQPTQKEELKRQYITSGICTETRGRIGKKAEKIHTLKYYTRTQKGSFIFYFIEKRIKNICK